MKKGLIYIILTAIVFTTLEPMSKLISTEITPINITFIRFFIGGLILLPFSISKIKKNNIKLKIKDYLSMTLLGVLCICVSMVLLQYAVLRADSPALIAIIFSSNSVFTIILASLILKDKMTPIKLVAIIISIVGILVSTDLKSSTNMFSVILAVLSSITFSLYTVLSKKYSQKVSGIIQTGISFFLGSIVLLIVLLIMGGNILNGIQLSNISILLYLGTIVTGLGYWSFFKAMDQASTMAASFVFFLKPILTPLATFFINGIVPNNTVFIALILVLIGSWLATYNKSSIIVPEK